MSGAREQAIRWLAEAENASQMDARAAAAQVAQVYALLGISDRVDALLEQLATRPRVVLGGEPAAGPFAARREPVMFPTSVREPSRVGYVTPLREERANDLEDQEQH